MSDRSAAEMHIRTEALIDLLRGVLAVRLARAMPHWDGALAALEANVRELLEQDPPLEDARVTEDGHLRAIESG